MVCDEGVVGGGVGWVECGNVEGRRGRRGRRGREVRRGVGGQRGWRVIFWEFCFFVFRGWGVRRLKMQLFALLHIRRKLNQLNQSIE